MTRPNVVLIVMDTARASSVLDRPDVTPNLHRIAERGVTFTNAFANGPWTLPSHASLFSGQYTSDHGTHAGSTQFDPDVPTVAERLSDAGYRTIAYSNNTWVSPEFGFDRGFDEFSVGWEVVDGGTDLATLGREHDSTPDRLRALARGLFDVELPQTVLNAAYAKLLRKRYDDGALVTNARLRRRLAGVADEQPFFLFVNYLEPHLEYDPPDAYRYDFLPDDVDPADADAVPQDAWSYICGREPMDDRDFDALAGLYDAELAYLDSRIGALYDLLEERGVLEDTAFVVTGDHGENLGEHDLMDHQYCLYDTVLHVPIVAQFPEATAGGDERDERSERGERDERDERGEHGERDERDELVELRDLYATLLDVAGVDVELPGDGAMPGDSPPQNVLESSGRDRVLAEYATPQPSMAALEDRVGHVPDSVHRYDRGLRCVRTKEWKYVEGTDGSEELYHVRSDPRERDDRAGSAPAVRSDLRETIHSRLGDWATDGEQEEDEREDEMEASTRERLEDLGYLQ